MESLWMSTRCRWRHHQDHPDKQDNGAERAHAVNLQLPIEAVGGRMKLANVKEQTARATKTLETSRREAEKLVLWFHDNDRHLTVWKDLALQ
jgi:hypothetical protein